MDPDGPFELEMPTCWICTVPPRIAEAVEAYLDEARPRHRFVRIIHGRSWLQRELFERAQRAPFVQQFSDARQAGGWGATIATLSLEPEQ